MLYDDKTMETSYKCLCTSQVFGLFACFDKIVTFLQRFISHSLPSQVDAIKTCDHLNHSTSTTVIHLIGISNLNNFLPLSDFFYYNMGQARICKLAIILCI
ncbi:uncharacterized protein BP01DRAFT_17981 [Aspergillus saccharolyticus JOP 1030-1]|uniref:Uncharacterized protein n=1 Tax=Aspergillus saccharolyticus JOP 1030-1 TaxID=1450539 RepID=A0A318ZGK6_9EURO|nr:hypothetical protein BP01DRAFT_17981 [Aspergillus saccharolyticus JOP 1030-1]PYH46599.1 hypothetical protein BP01DRAFT_17981 [Aspergillus saccharolyticus JOP 1030-1]